MRDASRAGKSQDLAYFGALILLPKPFSTCGSQKVFLFIIQIPLASKPPPSQV